MRIDDLMNYEAELRADAVYAIWNEMARKPDVPASELWALTMAKQPLPLWVHHEIKSVLKEGFDYVVRDGQFFLTRDSVYLVAIRQPTAVGSVLRKRQAITMHKWFESRGPEFGVAEMFAEAAQLAEDTARLQQLVGPYSCDEPGELL